MEQAIAAGWVSDAGQLQDWIGGLRQHSLCALDIPVLLRLHADWSVQDQAAVQYRNNWPHACRESTELQAEDRQLGNALARLLTDLGVEEARLWMSDTQATHASLVALAAACWHLGAQDMALGYLWSWCENQVTAALKLMSLGQTAGQRILSALIEQLPTALQKAEACSDADMASWHRRRRLRVPCMKRSIRACSGLD